MKITVTFDVDTKDCDPSQVAKIFEQYLREIMDIGYIEDIDPFTVMDCEIERALFQV